MSKAKFAVKGKFDCATMQPGSVVIDREQKTFSVRPRGRRRVFTLPLDYVAEIVCCRVIKWEVGNKLGGGR